jgi:hypothetical protein
MISVPEMNINDSNSRTDVVKTIFVEKALTSSNAS